jgi:hypothetical protein
VLYAAVTRERHFRGRRAVGVLDDRAVGDGEHHVDTVGAVAVTALTGLAGRRPAVRGVVVGQQRGGLGVDDQRNVAAATAVAAVGTAERLVLLAVDRGAAMAAVAGAGVQDDPVDERRHGVLLSGGSDLVGSRASYRCENGRRADRNGPPSGVASLW